MLKREEREWGQAKRVWKKEESYFVSYLQPSPFTPAKRATFNGPHAENIRMSQEVLTHRLRSAVIY